MRSIFKKMSLKTRIAVIILGVIVTTAPIIYTVYKTGLFSSDIHIEERPDTDFDTTWNVWGEMVNPPYSFFNDRIKPEGYEVELIYEIGQRAGVNVNITLAGSESVAQAFEDGRADIIMGQNILSTDTKSEILTTNTTCSDSFTLFGKTSLDNLYSLADKVVGISEDAASLTMVVGSASKKLYEDKDQLFMDLSEGKLDFVLCRRGIGRNIISKYGYSDIIDSIDADLGSNYYIGYAAKAENKDIVTELNIQLEKLRTEGYIEKFQQKWFERYYGRTPLKEVFAKNSFNYFIFLSILVVYFIAVFYTIYIISLEKKNAEIQERNHEIIDLLSENYEALMYYNIDTLDGELISLSDDIRKTFKDYTTSSKNLFAAMVFYIQNYVHPEDRKYFKMFTDPTDFKKIFAHNDRYSMVFRRMHGDRYRYMELIIAKFEEMDEPVKNLAIGFIDVDEKQRLELKDKERNNRIMSLADEFESIYDVNIDTGSYTVSTKNGVFTEELISNLTMDKDYFKSNRLNIPIGIYKDDQAMMLEAMSKEYMVRRLKKEGSYYVDYRCVLSDRVVWYRMRVVKNGDWTTSRRMLVGLFNNDANRKKEIEQQQKLETALDMAESANRAKTTFLNNMSHDIRTPMNAIIGFTGLARNHIDNKEQVLDYLRKIGQSSDHLLALINDVLDMSRIESGKISLNCKNEKLSEIIHALKNILLVDARSKGLDLTFEAINIEHECVVCDKLRLNQVLMNVISNSIKYTYSGGNVSVTVKELKSTEKTATYEFVVDDNGIGMTKEFLETIFVPFSRMKNSTVSGIQGTGLGMAITKNIIDMMEGTIDIDSAPDEGTTTTMIFTFELYDEDEENIYVEEYRNRRVLIVDDNISACESLNSLMHEYELRPEWCNSGEAAIERVKLAENNNESFDLFLIDYMMTGMNGVETSGRIRKMVGKDVPIIILTSYDWSDIEKEALKYGVSGFASKPMFPSDFNRVLKKCKFEDVQIQEENETNIDMFGIKVLLVEDNELNCEIAHDLLAEYGFVVETAENGQVALDILQNAMPGEFDLVLMDIQMPVMDGYEATRRIRELPDRRISTIPIIAMTANAFAEDKVLAMDAGMNDHIAKPINKEVVIKTISRFIKHI